MPVNHKYFQRAVENLTIFITLSMWLSWTSESSAYIMHCDPNTDAAREKILETFPLMKEFLENDHKVTAGRLGTLHFVNWQDKLFHLSSPGGNQCRWRMKSKVQREMDKFNGKFYVSDKLNADPLSVKNYYRLIWCEQKDCIQYFNVFIRPIAMPDFPVQIYEGSARDVGCNLDLMNDLEVPNGPRLSHHNPPYTFEWTGPKDCPKKNWNVELGDKSCVRYKSGNPDCQKSSGCNFKIDKSFTTESPNQSFPSDFEGYHKSEIKIQGDGKNQLKSTLKIRSATMEHAGQWRCIVYDGYGLSSHPTQDGQESLEKQEIVHRGIVTIRVKNQLWALGLPAGITLVIIIWSAICMTLCKQCTDFNEKEEEEEEEKEKAEAALKAKQEEGAGEVEALDRISRKSFGKEEDPTTTTSGTPPKQVSNEAELGMDSNITQQSGKSNADFHNTKSRRGIPKKQ